MAEMMVLSAVAEVTKRLVISLLEVRAAKQDNKKITREINEFVSDLDKNVARLKCKLPPNVSGGALDSLLRKLEEAQAFVQSRQDQNFFKSMWTAKQTTEKLNSQRRNLDSAFQLALFFTTLDVALEANKKIDDFQLKIQKISEASLRQFDICQGRNAEYSGASNAGKKFFADVLANISSQVVTSENEGSTITTEGDDEDEFNDPITYDRMCDPVKGTDGLTYDRWTIIENDLTESPFKRNKSKQFSIVCDDINVRRRLFSRFPGTEALFHERRASYRREALKLAHGGDDAEALLMLENVLEWDDEDADCQRLREVISRRIDQQKAEKAGELELDLPLSSSQEQLMNRTVREERVERMGAVHELKDIVRHLSKETPTTTLIKAAMSFANLAQAPENKLNMAKYPGALEKLVGLLTLDIPHDILFEAVRAFANLSSAQENRDKMARVPTAIERLACLMGTEVPVSVQSEAARAFANLALEEDHIVRMGAVPNVVETLVELLRRDAGENVQRQAVRALANLTSAEENVTKIAACPNTIGRVVDLLSKDTPVAVQLEAATVLANMVYVKAMAVKAFPNLMEGKEWLVELIDYPGALPKLIDLLAKETPESLQLHAARAIAHLTLDDKNLTTIANTEGGVERLVSLLTSSIPISVQERAVLAVANLICADGNKSMIVSFPGALEKLVTLLGKGVHSSLQFHAARAFAKLAREKENKVLMAGFPNAIERLVGLLAPDVEARVQSRAAGALANLTVEKQNAVKLATYEEVISSLTNLLSRDVPWKVQSNAMIAFANLAIPDENKRRLAEFPGVLVKLVDLLSHGVPETVQEEAARAFANLATARENKTLMASYPGALLKLVTLLESGVPSLQSEAARALAGLSRRGRERGKTGNI
ncbi:hypothetical protein R1sor_007863 [Riccia sorocarpa]|uniref:Vacuolar protein 8 n=1 Tax=Riccia sorocarpa TaxID=122646 RepID=A0ABD3HV67_9MARC